MLSPAESALIDVIHDLRQPLSNIEHTAYLMRALLANAPPQAREHLQMIERQLAVASHVLQQAAAGISRKPVQRAGREILQLTNSATAAVT